jgi:hypothetical protein
MESLYKIDKSFMLFNLQDLFHCGYTRNIQTISSKYCSSDIVSWTICASVGT